MIMKKNKIINLEKFKETKDLKDSLSRGRKSLVDDHDSFNDLVNLKRETEELKRLLFMLVNIKPGKGEGIH